MKQIAEFLKKNGFYVGLLCCVAIAIGAGYVIQSEIEPGTLSDEPLDAVEAPVQAFIAEPVIATDDVEENIKPTVTPPAAEPTAVTDASSVPTAAQPLPALVMPTEGEISRAFSYAPVFYDALEDWRAHTGIDITAEIGSDVTAAADGVVLGVTVDSMLGHCVVIDHGNMITHYANLYKDILVNPGQNVRRGDPIGHVGTSSLTEGAEDAHLHFAVQIGEEFCDPSEYLK